MKASAVDVSKIIRRRRPVAAEIDREGGIEVMGGRGWNYAWGREQGLRGRGGSIADEHRSRG